MKSGMINTPETLVGLLQHYSPSGAEKPAVEWLVTRMEALGFSRAFVDPAGNAVGMMGTGERQIVLLGHIDTVPGKIPLRLEGSLLFGRGAVDAKGPLAAFVDAVARVGPAQGYQLVVIGAVGEESESVGARYAVSEYQPQFAIIGEPSGWRRVTLGYKGSACANISVRQPRSHSSRQSSSACEIAFQTWNAVQEWMADFNSGCERLFDQLQVSLRGFSSGEDGFEEWATLQVEARLPLDLPPETWYGHLDRVCAGATMNPSGYPIPAYLGEKNTPLVRAFLAAIRAQGGRPGFVLKMGTADLNIVAPTWECPCLAYGPGDSNLDHTPKEHIHLKEYQLGVKVLSASIRQLVEVDSTPSDRLNTHEYDRTN